MREPGTVRMLAEGVAGIARIAYRGCRDERRFSQDDARETPDDHS